MPTTEKLPKKTASKKVGHASPETAKAFMAQLLAGFETDVNKETKVGKEIDLGSAGKFTLLRAHNRNALYAQAMQKHVVPFLESIQGLEDADEQTKEQNNKTAQRLMAKVFVDAIIIKVVSADGDEIPLDDESKPMLVDVLVKAPDLFQRIQNEAQDSNNYLARSAIVKN